MEQYPRCLIETSDDCGRLPGEAPDSGTASLKSKCGFLGLELLNAAEQSCGYELPQLLTLSDDASETKCHYHSDTAP